MSHAQDTLAVHRSVAAHHVRVTRELWRLFGRLKNELNILSAAAILATVGSQAPVTYRACLTELAGRTGQLAIELERLRDDALSADLDKLWGAVRSLAVRLTRHAADPPADATVLWHHAVETYAIGRDLAETRWAFEMRPEGLPLRQAVHGRFRLSP